MENIKDAQRIINPQLKQFSYQLHHILFEDEIKVEAKKGIEIKRDLSCRCKIKHSFISLAKL